MVCALQSLSIMGSIQNLFICVKMAFREHLACGVKIHKLRCRNIRFCFDSLPETFQKQSLSEKQSHSVDKCILFLITCILFASDREKSAQNCFVQGSKGGAVVRALASHQCGPGSNPGVDAICGLSLLLVLSLTPTGFSPGTPVFPSPQKPTLPNSNSIWNARTRLNEFI